MIAAKTPTRRHWDLFKIYKAKVAIKMEPEEFLKHWVVNYEELAELCGRSKSTVAHWFSQGEHRREPSEAGINADWRKFMLCGLNLKMNLLTSENSGRESAVASTI